DAMTAPARSAYRCTARASVSEIRGLFRTLSNSSSLRVIGNCSMLNESAPAWLRIACLTEALSPWISDTTAMIDVTATMLPSTVLNDGSLADEIAARAIAADSRNLFTVDSKGSSGLDPLISLAFRDVHFHRVAVGHAAHRAVRAGDHDVAGLQTA